MEIEKPKPEIKLNSFLMLLPAKMEEGKKKKINKMIWKETKRKNSFFVSNLRKKNENMNRLQKMKKNFLKMKSKKKKKLEWS